MLHKLVGLTSYCWPANLVEDGNQCGRPRWSATKCLRRLNPIFKCKRGG